MSADTVEVQGGTPNSPWGRQDGYALTEVLVVCVVGVLVLGAVIAFVAFSFSRNNVTVGRVDALDRTMLGVTQLQRELRQALDVQPTRSSPSASSYVDAKVYVQSTPTSPPSPVPHWVRYDCDNPGTVAGTSACTRQDQGPADQARNFGAPKTTVIDGISSSPVGIFTVVPPVAPAIIESVQIAMRVRIAGANNPLAIDTTVTPRNCLDGPTPGSTTCNG